MIFTAITHALIAAIVSVVGWLVGSLPVGVAVAVSFYLGREVAQHERKTPDNDPMRGFYFWKWSRDAQLDLLFPVIACVLVYVALMSF